MNPFLVILLIVSLGVCVYCILSPYDATSWVVRAWEAIVKGRSAKW